MVTIVRPFQMEPISDESFFGVQKWACRFMGIWPMDKQRPTILFYMSITALVFNTISKTWYGLANLGNLKLSIDTIAPLGTETLALYKIALLLYNRKEFGAQLEQLHKYLKNGRWTIH